MINIFEKFTYNGHIVDKLFEKDKKHINPNGLAIIISILKPLIRKMCPVLAGSDEYNTAITNSAQGPMIPIGRGHNRGRSAYRGQGRGDPKIRQRSSSNSRLSGRRSNSESDLLQLLRRALDQCNHIQFLMLLLTDLMFF